MTTIPSHIRTVGTNRAENCIKTDLCMQKTVAAAAVAPKINRASKCIKTREELTQPTAPVTATAPVASSTPHVVDPDRARACMVTETNPTEPITVGEPGRVQVIPGPVPGSATVRVDSTNTTPSEVVVSPAPAAIPAAPTPIPRASAMGVCVPVCDVVAETLYKTTTTEAVKIVCPNCSRDIVLINPSEVGYCPFCGAKLNVLAVTPFIGRALLVED